MASTYSDRLKLELMETGANANTWGNNTNTNLETLDAFTAGYLSKDVAGSANVTLTSNNADPTAESSNKVIEFTGTLTGDIHVFIPAVENNYIFFNNTSGSFTVTIAPDGHSANGVAITQGAHTIMYNTANNEIKDLFSGSLGNLSLVSGGVFTGNASGASALNASNVSSGTIDDARLTANVTLNNASTISAGTLADARLTANVTLNNASTISAGTLSNDRLDTVPTTKGGTGLTSLGSAGQVLTVSAPGSALEFADAGGGGIGNQTSTVFTSPGTFTANADLQFATIEVVGGGGGAGGSDASYNTAGSGQSSCFGTIAVAGGGIGGLHPGQTPSGAMSCGACSGTSTKPNALLFFGSDGSKANSPGSLANITPCCNRANLIRSSDYCSCGCGGYSSPGNQVTGTGGSGAAGMFAIVSSADVGASQPVTVGAGGTGGNSNYPLVNRRGRPGCCGVVRVTEFLP